MRRGHVLFLVALIAAVGLALRLLHLGADPPLALSLSNAEIMDGPWYLAEAADRARGLEPGVPPHYRKPIFTVLMRVAFLGGVSLERAHAAQAIVGALLVVVGAGAAWTAFGPRPALFTALFLATGFVPVGYGRTPVVYGTLAVGLAGVLWLWAAGRARGGQPLAPGEDRLRRVVCTGLAWALLGALVIWLQPVAVVIAPALVTGHLVQARHRARTLLALAIVGGLGALAFWGVDPYLFGVTIGKATAYLGASEPLLILKRWLRAPFTSGLWPKAPLVCLLAWAGVLAALARRPPGAARESRAVEAALAAGYTAWMGVFGLFEYTEGGPPPLRYFMPGLVPAGILAARLLDRSVTEPGLVVAAPRPVLFAWGTLGAYWTLGTVWMGLWPALAGEGSAGPAWLLKVVSFPSLLSAAVLLGAAVAFLVGPRLRGRPVRLGFASVAALLAAGLVADASRLYPMLTRPTYTLRDANRIVARLLAPNAALFGPYAHALTYEARLLSRHVEALDLRAPGSLLELKTRRFTHLVIDARMADRLEASYRQVDAPLVPLGRLHVRGHPLKLYRFAWAEEIGYRLSPLETQVATGAPCP